MICLVDGHCHLCHGITRFVIQRDLRKTFYFASLQSKVGRYLLERGQLPTDDLDTFVLIEGGRYYTKSSAALRVFRQFPGWWPLLYATIVVPRFIRDRVYDFIALHRYRWFGREEACLMPTPEMRGRFLEEVADLWELEGDRDAPGTDLC